MEKEKKKTGRESGTSSDSEIDKVDEKSEGASSDRSSVELPEPRQFVPKPPSPFDPRSRELEFAMSYDFDAQSIDFRRLFSTGTEVANPVRARVRGKIPDWLSGTLLRNGPGMYEIGMDKYNNWFDPLSMIQRFHIDPKGRVFYTAQFLQSETFLKNQAAGKIVVSEFGTPGTPDPKKNFISRYFSHLFPKDQSDNNLHNFVLLGDAIYTTNESGFLNRINWDTRTIGTCKQENLKKHVAVNSINPHPHYDVAGNVYTVGTGNSSFYFIKITPPERQRMPTETSETGSPDISRPPPKSGEERKAFESVQILGGVPFQNGSQPAYCHSFGMSEHHFALFEIPLFLNGLKYKFRHFSDKAVVDCLDWHSKKKVH